MNDSVRQMWIICGTHVRRVLVDRGTAIWLLALPLALIGVLGMSLQSLMSADFIPPKPYRVVVAESASGDHEALLRPLQALPRHLEVSTAPTPGEARDMVVQRQADAAVVVTGLVPETGELTVSLISAPGAVITEMMTSILDEVLLQIQANSAASTRAVRTEAHTEGAAGDGVPAWLQTDAFTYYAVGITAMFVMFAAHAVSVTAVRDRATDVYARLRALGVTPAAYMLGGSAASIVVSVLFASVMAVVSRLLFGVTWGHALSWLALTLTGATAAAGLSLAVMALFPKPEHVDGAGGAIFNILAFLGGSMTPLHVLPEWFRTSLAWLPNRAVLAGYLKASRGAEPAAVSGELTTLAAAAAVLFALGWLAWNVRGKEEA